MGPRLGGSDLVPSAPPELLHQGQLLARETTLSGSLLDLPLLVPHPLPVGSLCCVDYTLEHCGFPSRRGRYIKEESGNSLVPLTLYCEPASPKSISTKELDRLPLSIKTLMKYYFLPVAFLD